jgi:hypothetical protein
MLNAMATTLEQAGLPLTASQASALEARARAAMARDRQRLQGYDDRTWMVRKIYEEAELKDAFFAEAFSLMTAEQVELLSPPLCRGRVRLDLFSASLIFSSLSRPEFFDTPEGLVESTLGGASARLELTDAERVTARPVVAAWVERLPRELTEHETDALDVHGLVPVKLVITAARQQERLLEDLVRTLAVDEERIAKVREYPLIHVPLPRRDTGE